jgi:hypothetical protein
VSNAIDDKELDEYLSGDTQYSQRYRAISADKVPAELDQLVLSQVSTPNVTPIDIAVEKRTARRTKPLAFWMRVSVPMALAASFVLVMSIVIDSDAPNGSVREMRDDASAVSPSQQAVRLEQPPASPAPTLEAKEAEMRDRSSAIAAEQSRAAQKTVDKQASQAKLRAPALQAKSEDTAMATLDRAAEEASVSGNFQAAAPAAASAPRAEADQKASADSATAERRVAERQTSVQTDLSEIVVTAQVRKQSANSGAGPHSTVPPANFEEREPSDAELAKQYREATPTAWLTYIRELRTNGKSSTADREWKRFVKAYPNYTVDQGDSARPRK